MAPRSKVEISGHWASWYDLLIDTAFLGNYPRFMGRVTSMMGVEPGDEILDMGSGTGRNALLMLRSAGEDGRVVGLDISERMLRRARRRCRRHSQITFAKQRIELPLPHRGEFDKVFLSFVLHGLENPIKRSVIANARKALRPGGSLWILDYDEFDLRRVPWPVRLLFRHLECELATEFLSLDLKGMLAEGGFADFTSHPLLLGYVRLLGARKQLQQ